MPAAGMTRDEPRSRYAGRVSANTTRKHGGIIRAGT